MAQEEPSERQRVWTVPPSDVVVLCRTLARDQALPSGYEEAFVSLAPHILSASSRQRARLAATENVQAALDLHEREKQERMLAKRGPEVAQGPIHARGNETAQDVCLVSSASNLPGTPTLVRGQRTPERVRWQISWQSPPLPWERLSG